MKFQKMLLVVSMVIFFGVCYFIMNRYYDPLARYPYATSENRELIISSISKHDIQFIIDENIRPEQFLSFVGVDGFNIKNTVAYYEVSKLSSENAATIVSFVNQAMSKYSLEQLLELLNSYSFSNIIDWINYGDVYAEGSNLVINPTANDVILNRTNTVGRYQPSDLVRTDALSTLISQGDFLLREEANDKLDEMCAAIEGVFSDKCGGLIATQGYTSYEAQRTVYDRYLLEYGPSGIFDYFNYPGHNEFQLGNTLTVLTAKTNESTFAQTAQYNWLKNNAYKYGFVFRYDYSKQDVESLIRRSNQLRYVGVELATTLHNENIVLDELMKVNQ